MNNDTRTMSGHWDSPRHTKTCGHLCFNVVFVSWASVFSCYLWLQRLFGICGQGSVLGCRGGFT